MKIRTSFVSNSSSSSFAIAKNVLTKQQLKSLSNWIDRYNDSEKYDGGYIFEHRDMFHGEVDNYANIYDFLDSIGVKKEDYSLTC